MGRRTNWQGMNWIRKDKRLAIYLRDGLACVYCGSGIEDSIQLSLDHVVPVEHGGENGEENLVTACRKCNQVRSSRTVIQFAVDVAYYLDGDVTAREIVLSVERLRMQSLKPFRIEAKAILARRPQWQQALEEAAEMER